MHNYAKSNKISLSIKVMDMGQSMRFLWLISVETVYNWFSWDPIGHSHSINSVNYL